MSPDLAGLRARIRAIEGGGTTLGREVARLGPALDGDLPWGGLPAAALHEIGGPAASAAAIAFARRCLRAAGRPSLVPERSAGRPAWRALRAGAAALRDRPRTAPDRPGAGRAAGLVGLRGGAALAGRGLRRSRDRAARSSGEPAPPLAAETGGGTGLALRHGPPDPAPNAALTRWRATPALGHGRRAPPPARGLADQGRGGRLLGGDVG